MTTTLLIAAVVIFGFIAYVYYSYKKIKNTPEAEMNAAIKNLTDQNFQAQIKSGVTLVDFWAAWCMPCKMMVPILNEVADEIGDSAKIAKLDVEANRNSSAKYGVRNIPTMVLFKNGKEINRFVGAKTKSFLVNEINKVK
jgi:thioredoxin 1